MQLLNPFKKFAALGSSAGGWGRSQTCPAGGAAHENHAKILEKTSQFRPELFYILFDGSGFPGEAPLSKGDSRMDNSTLSAVLWIAAGAVLALYLLRRRKRKTMGK